VIRFKLSSQRKTRTGKLNGKKQTVTLKSRSTTNKSRKKWMIGTRLIRIQVIIQQTTGIFSEVMAKLTSVRLN